MSGSSLPRAWRWWLDVRVITVKGLDVRVITVKGLNVVWMSGSSLSRAWMLESSLSRAWNVVSGCQGHHCQEPKHCVWRSVKFVWQKKFFYKTFFQALESSLSRAWTLSGCQGHHCQGPEGGDWMSGSSLPRAWTWCLDVRVITVKGLDVRVITVKGLKRCVWMSGSSLPRA